MEDLIEVYKASRESQNKYVYFLLAVVGAMIALVIQQTSESSIVLSQIPLAMAVLSWALSFYCGCYHIKYVNSLLYVNMEILKAENDTHPELYGKGLAHKMSAIKGMKDAFNYNSDKANSYVSWQFKLLVIGTIFYLTWHIIGMYLRTIH